jgi:hypothetical protein
MSEPITGFKYFSANKSQQFQCIVHFCAMINMQKSWDTNDNPRPCHQEIVAEVPGFNNQEMLPSSDIQFLTPTASMEVSSFIPSSPEVQSTVPAKGIDSSQIHVMKPLH